jgi:predicted small lipoprotein YifL
MVPPIQELFAVPRWFAASSYRLVVPAALAVLVLALGLGACGRKGPLDPPPGAAAPGPAPEDVLKFGAAPGTPGPRSD